MSEETGCGGLPILHFKDAAALRAWLEQQPESSEAAWLDHRPK
jgi:hypothetical protein